MKPLAFCLKNYASVDDFSVFDSRGNSETLRASCNDAFLIVRLNKQSKRAQIFLAVLKISGYSPPPF